METALSTIEVSSQPATAVQIRQQVNSIQEVMKAVFKKDTHYGIIPGTPKPTLYKAGSEVILTMFRIAVTPEVDDLSTHDERRFRVRAVGRTPNGTHVGTGIGECSSNEEKYKWRAANCKAEFDATDIDRRRIKYTKKNEQIPQIRMNPEDIANTVLKMAKKRAQIDLCLTATAASDVFTQDIEDLPEGADIGHEEKTVKPTQRRSSAPAEKPADDPSSNGQTPAGAGEEIIEFVPLDCQKFKNKANGGTRYEVVLPDNRKCSSFDDKVGDALKNAAADGAKVRAVIETVVKGDKTFTNFIQVQQAS